MGTQKKTYSKKFDNGLNFARNAFLYSSSGSLSLVDDFQNDAGSDKLYLADFADGSYTPSGSTWTIYDTTAETTDFIGLKSSIQKAKKYIYLIFPNLTDVPDSAFEECGYIASMNAPNVKTIGSKSFYECSKLAFISFIDATTVDRHAFTRCYALTNVDLPAVTKLGESAFFQCYNIITFSAPKTKEIERDAFSDCRELESISFPNLTTFTDHNYVTGVFEGCSSLSSAYLPLVTSLHNCTFKDCTILKTVTCPNVTLVKQEAFYNCQFIQSVSLSKVTNIEKKAFYNCNSLTSAAFPAVTSIGDYVFCGCENMETLELATNDNTIINNLGSYVFKIDSSNNQEANITLTIGAANQNYVNSKTLSLGENTYTFSSIIINGRTKAAATASIVDSYGIGW